MFQFLLVVHVIIAISMVGVILMQRSEGGGLTGGSPAGLMSARGAADFLTRTTTILATLFVGLSIALATYATVSRAPKAIDTSLSRKKGVIDPATPGVIPTGAANAVVVPPVPMAVPATNGAPVTAPEQPANQSAGANPKKTVEKQPEAKVSPKPVVEKPVSKPVIKPVPVPEKPILKLPVVPSTDSATKVPEGLIPPANPQ
jgi:preprotein translocase subunit SecG